jgi:GGDEF domain-containing protein
VDYDGVHAFLDNVYGKGGVFRQIVSVLGKKIFSTATVGCAIYPKDADSYADLFALVDKTLYRGKSKGRNCFII